MEGQANKGMTGTGSDQHIYHELLPFSMTNQREGNCECKYQTANQLIELLLHYVTSQRDSI